MRFLPYFVAPASALGHTQIFCGAASGSSLLKPSPLMGEGLGGGEPPATSRGSEPPRPISAPTPALAAITPTPTRPHQGGGSTLPSGLARLFVFAGYVNAVARKRGSWANAGAYRPGYPLPRERRRSTGG